MVIQHKNQLLQKSLLKEVSTQIKELKIKLTIKISVTLIVNEQTSCKDASQKMHGHSRGHPWSQLSIQRLTQRVGSLKTVWAIQKLKGERESE